MKLLIVTQKVDENDPILGFFHGWIAEFAKHCEYVTVICLGEGTHHLPQKVKVLSLGKENFIDFKDFRLYGLFQRFRYVLHFWKYIWQERKNYDAAFVHMNQEYVVLGGVLWRLLGKRVGLWYAHGKTSVTLRIAEIISDKIFTSTPEGFRLKSKKVFIAGQGIDTDLFYPQEKNEKSEKFRIMSVGRISPSKDIATMIDAVSELVSGGEQIQCEFIGEAGTSSQEKYFADMRQRAKEKGVGNIILFSGKIVNKDLPSRLRDADVFVNAGLTGSLDKAAVEAMAAGILVITCNEAIAGVLGSHADILTFPKGNAKVLAEKIRSFKRMNDDERKMIGNTLRETVLRDHSLERFVKKITQEYERR